MKKKWVIPSSLIVCIVILVIMFLGLDKVMFFVKKGFFSGTLITYNEIQPVPSIDFVSNLISAYSLFITVVLFVLGVPIALLGYSSWKNNEEFRKEFETKFESIKKDNDKFRDDSKKEFETKFESIENDNDKFKNDSKKEFETNMKPINTFIVSIEIEAKENNAYKEVEKAYNDDPECLTGPEGKNYLGEFSKSFVEKQTREAKRYFFEGISYSQNKVRDINKVKSDQDLYTDDKLRELIIAAEYFSMCEKKLPYLDKVEDRIFRSSLYNEKALTLKYLGLYYYYHNSILSMDYLLAALEYFQKAVQSDDRDVLPFNSKSNILKDIYRLILQGKEYEKIEKVLLEKLCQKLVSMSLCVFDIKNIIKFTDTIPLTDRIHFRINHKLDEFRKATEHCNKDKCFKCMHLCHNCAILFKDIDSDLLLYMVLLESIICVQNEVLSPERIYKFNRLDINEKYNRKYNEKHKYWCYLTCAISYYLMFNYSSGSIDSNNNEVEENYWYKNFFNNLSSAIKEGISLVDIDTYEHIKQDKDLESFRKRPNWEDQLRKKVAPRRFLIRK